jgi:hypothetical protein
MVRIKVATKQMETDQMVEIVLQKIGTLKLFTPN